MFRDVDITHMLLTHKREFLEYKVVFICRKCKKKIYTTWNKDFTLEGDFFPDDVWWGDVLDCTVSDPVNVCCWSCAGTRKWLK